MEEIPGETFRDYRLIERIDNGSCSHVWLALHIPSNTKVAMKIIPKCDIKNSDLMLKFICGVTLMKHIKHPLVTRFFEVVETDNNFVIVQQYCERGTLETLINEKKVLCEDTALKIFTQIAVALDFLHTKVHVAHRYIKPQNILLDSKIHVHIADFGLSKAFTEAKPLFSTLCGTPKYIAPEMLNSQQYTSKADVWSLGIILYYMVVGNVPFDGDTVAEISQKISYSDPYYPPYLSTEIIDLLQKLLRKNPDQRLTSSQVLQHKWLNHTNFIQIIQQNIEEFFRVESNSPKFKTLSEKIIFVQHENEEFDLEQQIKPKEIQEEPHHKVSSLPKTKLPMVKIMKTSRSGSATFKPQKIKKVKSQQLNFPKLKSSI